MNQSPVELNLSLDHGMFIRETDGCYYLVLDIGEVVSSLDSSSFDGEAVYFVADDVSYVQNIPSDALFLFDKEVVFLQIKNYVVDELFDEIEGPSVEIAEE